MVGTHWQTCNPHLSVMKECELIKVRNCCRCWNQHLSQRVSSISLLSASAIAAASRRLKFKTDIRRRECKAMHLACNAIIYLLPARVQKHKPQCKNLPLAARTSSPANKSNTQINKRIVYTVRAYPIHTQGIYYIKYVYSVDKMMCSRHISLQGEDAVAKAGQRSALTYQHLIHSPDPRGN